jgi:hypothetical protein
MAWHLRWPVLAICALFVCHALFGATVNFTFLDPDRLLYGAVDQDTPDRSTEVPPVSGGLNIAGGLSGGLAATTGDGVLVEILADAGGGLLTLAGTFTVGDGLEFLTGPDHNGRFAVAVTIDALYGGDQLTLRYYDAVDTASAAFFGELTNPDWIVPEGTGVSDPFDLTDAATIGRLNSSGFGPEVPRGAPIGDETFDGYYTNLPIPEPGSVLLALAGAGWLGLRRRRS